MKLSFTLQFPITNKHRMSCPECGKSECMWFYFCNVCQSVNKCSHYHNIAEDELHDYVLNEYQLLESQSAPQQHQGPPVLAQVGGKRVRDSDDDDSVDDVSEKRRRPIFTRFTRIRTRTSFANCIRLVQLFIDGDHNFYDII